MADVETNVAYGIHGKASAVENHTYELLEIVPAAKKACSGNPTEMGTKKDYCFKIFVAVIASTALLLVLIFLSFFLFHFVSYQPFVTQQSAAIESLQSLLNSSNEQLSVELQSLRMQLNKTVKLQESLQSEFQIFIREQQTNDLLNQNRIQEIEQELNSTVN